MLFRHFSKKKLKRKNWIPQELLAINPMINHKSIKILRFRRKKHRYFLKLRFQDEKKKDIFWKR